MHVLVNVHSDLLETVFHAPIFLARQPVPVTSDQEMSIIKSRIAELKAMLNKDSKDKDKTGKAMGKVVDKDGSFVSRP